MRHETILNVFPSNDPLERLVIALEQPEGDASRIVLRQESFSDDVGWFVQSRVVVEAEQIAGLKMTLTGSAMRPIQRPAILRFDRSVVA